MKQCSHTGMRDESGVALLSALFAVALLTVIVIEMTDATMVHSHLNRNAGNAMAAQLLARSAAVAGEALITNDDANPQGITCPQDLWALPLIGIPAGPGVVGLQISDESGKLDLNAVRDAKYRTAVQSLFSSLDIDPSLVDRIVAWITPANAADGAMATGGGSDYCALAMSCVPRQQPLNSLDELLLIRGFDEQTIARLRPYATALPRSESRGGGAPRAVNLLTAKPLVRTALGCEGGDDMPECLRGLGTSDEKKTEWKTEFDAWKTANCSAAPANLLGVNSTVFSILASGTVGDVTQSLRTVVERKGKRAKRLWWQERPLSEVLPVEVR